MSKINPVETATTNLETFQKVPTDNMNRKKNIILSLKLCPLQSAEIDPPKLNVVENRAHKNKNKWNTNHQGSVRS